MILDALRVEGYEAALHAFLQLSYVRVMVAQLRALGISVEVNQERYRTVSLLA